eukprot:1310900-Prymnesium_polylepis.2
MSVRARAVWRLAHEVAPLRRVGDVLEQPLPARATATAATVRPRATVRARATARARLWWSRCWIGIKRGRVCCGRARELTTARARGSRLRYASIMSRVLASKRPDESAPVLLLTAAPVSVSALTIISFMNSCIVSSAFTSLSIELNIDTSMLRECGTPIASMSALISSSSTEPDWSMSSALNQFISSFLSRCDMPLNLVTSTCMPASHRLMSQRQSWSIARMWALLIGRRCLRV